MTSKPLLALCLALLAGTAWALDVFVAGVEASRSARLSVRSAALEPPSSKLEKLVAQDSPLSRGHCAANQPPSPRDAGAPEADEARSAPACAEVEPSRVLRCALEVGPATGRPAGGCDEGPVQLQTTTPSVPAGATWSALPLSGMAAESSGT